MKQKMSKGTGLPNIYRYSITENAEEEIQLLSWLKVNRINIIPWLELNFTDVFSNDQAIGRVDESQNWFWQQTHTTLWNIGFCLTTMWLSCMQ